MSEEKQRRFHVGDNVRIEKSSDLWTVEAVRGPSNDELYGLRNNTGERATRKYPQIDLVKQALETT